VGCVLDLPFRHIEAASDAYFMSRDVYGHRCHNHGAAWNLDGRWFDGSNDYVDAGGHAALDPGAGSWTVEVRFRSTNQARQGLVYKDDNTDGHYLDIYDSQQVHFLVRDGGSADAIAGSTLGLTDGQPHLTTGIRDEADGKLRLFLDGDWDAAPVTAANTGGADVAPSANAEIGRLSPTAFKLKGLLCRVRLYNRAEHVPRLLQRAMLSRRS